MKTANAKDYLPADLIAEVIEALEGNTSRRISFQEIGSELTPTELALSKDLVERCRVAIKPRNLPVRLYFSSRTKRAGRPPLPFRDIAVELVNMGHRTHIVAEIFGIAPQTVNNWGAKQESELHEVVGDAARARAVQRAVSEAYPASTDSDYLVEIGAALLDRDILEKNA